MKEGERMEHTFEKRKKVIYDLICDDLYVPMKLKEIAMLLQIPREQRNELKGSIGSPGGGWQDLRLKEREICQRTASVFKRNISGESSRIRICAQRG